MVKEGRKRGEKEPQAKEEVYPGWKY